MFLPELISERLEECYHTALLTFHAIPKSGNPFC